VGRGSPRIEFRPLVGVDRGSRLSGGWGPLNPCERLAAMRALVAERRLPGANEGGLAVDATSRCRSWPNGY
jgi:hypothetical protein